ncbi:hypothetical protein AO411_2027635 [Salmonella enterica subsp. enterica serovar Sarajane]|nr:hypothetical protein AO411_2027635 [Salmonella enterica subsp. enterica serovar Sarajane]
MEARQGGDSLAGSVHDSPPRQGDARNSGRSRQGRTVSTAGNIMKRKNRIMIMAGRRVHRTVMEHEKRMNSAAY